MGSSEENVERLGYKVGWNEESVSRTAVGVRQEETHTFLESVGSKDNRRDWNVFQDESLRAKVKQINNLLTNDDGKVQTLQIMEESCETSSLVENGSVEIDEESEYIPTNGCDADGALTNSQENILLSFSQEASSQSNHQEWVVSNPEHEVAFGGGDWGEYLHEHKGEVDGSREFWIAVQEGNIGHGQVDAQNCTDDIISIELAQLEGLDGGYLSGDSAKVRGTGRPDLDDVEDDFRIAEDSIPQRERSTFPDGCQSSGSVGQNLEDDLTFCDERVSEGCNLEAARDLYDITSRINRKTSAEDPDELLFKLHVQANLDELRGAFSKRLNRQADDTVRLRIESDEFQPFDDITGSAAGFLEPQTQKAFLERKGAGSEVVDKDTGLRSESCSNLIPATNLQGLGTLEDLLSPESQLKEFLPGGNPSEVVADDFRRKSIGSKKSEELLQMDIAKGWRAVDATLYKDPKVSCVQDLKRTGVDWPAEDLGPDELSRYVEALEVKETYVDTVLDMEDILFDAEEGSGARTVHPFRDGSLSASTSSSSLLTSRQLNRSVSTWTEVDWVEVVGASQQRGRVSLGERVVGVKEHTIYRIRVQGGGHEWEVHRRYRDFVALYNQLQQMFTGKTGVHLPTPWTKVKAESRKFFGNTSPDIVEGRSALVQVCLQSLLQAGPPLNTAAPFLRFLFDKEDTTSRPQSKLIGEGLSEAQVLLEDFVDFKQESLEANNFSNKADRDQDDGGSASVFGKTIRLIVQIHKKTSLKQQLQAQHSTCAGCYKHLELALGLVPELVQNWGWRGPRLCEYSGQLFCSTCHLNESAVIPAWVLQRWDFGPRQVSQLAKAYLDSIYDKPMLCVSAVNPYLYARVPVLAHLMELRRKLSKMLAYIRCSARGRILATLGARRYLLENNDFFALRDLVDLSKGAFAVLPGYMGAMLLKVTMHITRECSVCRELGEACAAGELCDDAFDLIYPYQDEKFTRCQLCHLPYHKRCFRKLEKTSSCTRCKSAQTVNSDLNQHNSDLLYRQLGATSSGQYSPVAQGRDNSPSCSSVAVYEHKIKAKKNGLSNLLGVKEAQGESQRDNRDSVFLNMRALESPLEL